MSMFSHKERKVPGLNTASLPDLIFTVLFFFMIVTHMREVQLKVKYEVPQGTGLERLVKKSAVSYIYIGKPLNSEDSTAIQINDKFVSIDEVADFVVAERMGMSPEDRERMTVSIKADKDVKMGIITDVKQVLRRSNVLNINYSANENKNNINFVSND